MRIRHLALVLLACLASAAVPSADEGMWTFDNPPRRLWKERYNFEPTDQWLDHVRLASVRLNDGGSGGFVSADGLLITNQHVAAGQLQKLSTADHDYTRDGFYAPSRAQELKCPDLEVNVLESYENVSGRVQGAVTPGATGPQASEQRRGAVAQIEYQRDAGNPLQMQVWTSRRDALVRYGQTSPEAARQMSSARRSLENSIKRLVGQQEGLMNPRIMGAKKDEERALRDAVARNPALQAKYGDAWDLIAAVYRDYPAMARRIAFSSLTASRLGSLASQIVRYAAEVPKPNASRYDEFRDSKLESLKFNLLSPAPLYPEMETTLLASWLEQARNTLGASDPFVIAALQGSTPDAVAKSAIGGTKLTDVGARKALLDGGADGVARSTDPLIALARRVEPIIRELRAWNEEKLLSVEAAAGERIAAARFAVYGKTVSPDATFSLRLSYGRVLGYEEDTTRVPFKTTFYGLFDRAEGFGYAPPFSLPQRWLEKRAVVDLATPLNFVYTADTIGGNSGSPILNREAELVGINFDSNLQKLANRYLYIDEKEGSRAVGVHGAAILEGLRKVYGAQALVTELVGS